MLRPLYSSAHSRITKLIFDTFGLVFQFSHDRVFILIYIVHAVGSVITRSHYCMTKLVRNDSGRSRWNIASCSR